MACLLSSHTPDFGVPVAQPSSYNSGSGLDTSPSRRGGRRAEASRHFHQQVWVFNHELLSFGEETKCDDEDSSRKSKQQHHKKLVHLLQGFVGSRLFTPRCTAHTKSRT